MRALKFKLVLWGGWWVDASVCVSFVNRGGQDRFHVPYRLVVWLYGT